MKEVTESQILGALHKLAPQLWGASLGFYGLLEASRRPRAGTVTYATVDGRGRVTVRIGRVMGRSVCYR